MLVVAGLILGQFNFLVRSRFFRSKIYFVKVVANLSLHSKLLELGQDVLRYSNSDRIMTCPNLQEIGNGIRSGPPDTA